MKKLIQRMISLVVVLTVVFSMAVMRNDFTPKDGDVECPFQEEWSKNTNRH